MTANCGKRANVRTLAFIIDRRSVSPRAAARALCLSGSPLGFFFHLHLRVVRIFQIRVRLLYCQSSRLPCA